MNTNMINRPAESGIDENGFDKAGIFWGSDLQKMQLPVLTKTHIEINTHVPVFHGREAQKMCHKLFDDLFYKKCKAMPFCMGIFAEQGVFIAFDNSTGDCWTEEFDDRIEALAWLNQEEIEF